LKIINCYNNLILDCDGVILDSNLLKEKNIYESVLKFTNKETARNFTQYFIDNNGLPREQKVKTYFGNTELFESIITHYNNLNQTSLLNAPFTLGFEDFLNKVNMLKCYVLSGGDEEELNLIFKSKRIDNKFVKIMGAPKTKFQHLLDLNLSGKTLYIGDSRLDYEVAKKFQYDFIFMTDYTQFTQWKDFFGDKPDVKIINNLSVIC
jgi:phosphoglycolate phosphatase-like HAD superfamily hydrolase